QKYVQYLWRELERTLRQYAASPDEQVARQVEFFRAVLLHQLSAPGALPEAASGPIKKLLVKPLALKKELSDAVETLEGNPEAYDKAIQLSIVEEKVVSAGGLGQEVGALFLGNIAALAWDEMDANVARRVGSVLSRISGIPCDLDRTKLETRRRNLREWLDAVRAGGVAVEFSPGAAPPS
ncbi:MAG: hypothetical protein ACYS8K_07865, partial [Planctomycetota bacterium]